MEQTLSKFSVLLIVLVWTATIGGFLVWDQHVHRKHAEDLARNEALSHFKKDLAFRMWATRHGGMYVPIDERTPPNLGLGVCRTNVQNSSSRLKK